MRAGDRIGLIKQSLPLLAAMDYNELQLTLDQHGFNTYNYAVPEHDREPETLTEYCTYLLKRATDSQLQELTEYLAASTSGTPPTLVGKSPWSPAALARVFISHVTEDAAFAANLSSTLNLFCATDGFVAHTQIEPSQPWREQITHGLATCDMLVAILHERFHASPWCDQEVGWALGRGVPVLPVRTKPNLLRNDGFIGERQDCTVDLTRGDPTHTISRHVVQTLFRNPSSARIGTNVTVCVLERSSSYATTCWAWELLASRPEINVDQARRLVTAATNNSQVRDPYTEDRRHRISDLIHRLCDPIIAADPAPQPPF